jgi:hypothetical protein
VRRFGCQLSGRAIVPMCANQPAVGQPGHSGPWGTALRLLSLLLQSESLLFFAELVEPQPAQKLTSHSYSDGKDF